MKISLEMWQNLTAFANFYLDKNYLDFAQPWFASQQATEVTLPPGAVPTVLHGESLLLGSSEQAFIDRMIEGHMPSGRWQALTPCFRREPTYDTFHHPYFMKLELIHYQPLDAASALSDMLEMALKAFQTVSRHSKNRNFQIEQTDMGYDLTLAGHELGSYGVRTYQDHTWVYGTGLAEPRFTTVLRSTAI